MRSLLRRCLRHHAAAAAYLALLASVGGTAYAAATITGEDVVDETIASEDIRDNTLRGQDVANYSIGAADVRDDAISGNHVSDSTLSGEHIAVNSLRGEDVANNSLRGEDIDESTLKSDLRLTTVSKESGSAWAATKTVTAQCPSGYKALGGGATTDAPYYGNDGKFNITSSGPSGNGTGWTITAGLTQYPGIPEFTFAYEDGYVTGFKTYIVEDNFSHRSDWTVTARAVCAYAD